MRFKLTWTTLLNIVKTKVFDLAFPSFVFINTNYQQICQTTKLNEIYYCFSIICLLRNYFLSLCEITIKEHDLTTEYNPTPIPGRDLP